jgi:hypothetical protein
MLDTSSTGAEINSRRVPWKDKVAQAPDSSRVAAWRNELTRRDNQLSEALVGGWLEAFGYPRAETFTQLGELRPGLSAAVKHPDALATLAAQGIRFWRASVEEKPDRTIFLGDPGSQEWGRTKAVLLELVLASLSGRRVSWIFDDGVEQRGGYRSSVLRMCLAPFRLSAEPISQGGGRS